MKTWPYDGEDLTLKELWEHPDCETSLFDLEFCLVRKNFPAKKAMKTKLPKHKRPSVTFQIHGMELTRKEILELSQCEVSYWTMNRNLAKGHPIEEAIKKDPKPLQRRKIKKYCKTDLKSVLQEIGSPYTEAQGSQIKLNQRASRYPVELSWDYIAAKRLGRLLEERHSEVELAKQLNDEDCTQRTR